MPLYDVTFTFKNKAQQDPLTWLIEADNEGYAMRAIYAAWQPPAPVGKIEIHENTKYFQITMKKDYENAVDPSATHITSEAIIEL